MWPMLHASHLKNGQLVWVGELQSTPGGNSYLIRIEYQPPGHPKVYLLRPKLVLTSKGQDFNHVYKDGRLCLYDSRVNEWTHEMGIARSIVPWTILWLFFYEVWLQTGKWCGEEAVHSVDKDADSE